ncbi:hypothetical protein H696_01974 [Fonticula alba]|uniref:Uncharacterized protein n=1 Tax=Fonticula alba TaxID=691883 RepID=A0A058ZAS8_FONAL|nr:hypothetical protein H696_01974 [Fonticula alba]KCV71028.1 hypothetical protein H696_01974 [Fonticula alba]|eukprot:XP_009494151.1 hypothetical protein H696_01974 [Fonticula alba]
MPVPPPVSATPEDPSAAGQSPESLSLGLDPVLSDSDTDHHHGDVLALGPIADSDDDEAPDAGDLGSLPALLRPGGPPPLGAGAAASDAFDRDVADAIAKMSTMLTEAKRALGPLVSLPPASTRAKQDAARLASTMSLLCFGLLGPSADADAFPAQRTAGRTPGAQPSPSHPVSTEPLSSIVAAALAPSMGATGAGATFTAAESPIVGLVRALENLAADASTSLSAAGGSSSSSSNTAAASSPAVSDGPDPGSGLGSPESPLAGERPATPDGDLPAAEPDEYAARSEAILRGDLRALPPRLRPIALEIIRLRTASAERPPSPGNGALCAACAGPFSPPPPPAPATGAVRSFFSSPSSMISRMGGYASSTPTPPSSTAAADSQAIVRALTLEITRLNQENASLKSALDAARVAASCASPFAGERRSDFSLDVGATLAGGSPAASVLQLGRSPSFEERLHRHGLLDTPADPAALGLPLAGSFTGAGVALHEAGGPPSLAEGPLTPVRQGPGAGPDQLHRYHHGPGPGPAEDLMLGAAGGPDPGQHGSSGAVLF